MKTETNAESIIFPATNEAIERARSRCLRLVQKRAAIAAGVAVVPLPGVAMLSDLATFALLVEEINQAFGLTPAQIDCLHPRMRVAVYEAAAALGGMLVGKVVTRELVLRVLRKAGVKLAAKNVVKVVPLAGQIASAAIGFVLFRQLGYQHVAACVKVAQQVAKEG